jgi:Helix-turn-helix domain
MTKAALLTNIEAADYLRLSPRTLDRWRWAGRGPKFKKIGGAIRYALNDLNDFAQIEEAA